MRIAAFTTDADGVPAAGAVEGDEIVTLGTDVASLLSGEDLPAPSGERFPLDAVRLHAPLRPRNVICIGTNYVDHALEVALPVPAAPLVFAKFTNAICGPGDAIVIPAISSQVDYEAELAVVIGAGGGIFGYTAFNDVSARDLQFSEGGQWSHSKSLDTFAPIGPWIVTADEVPDPQALRIRTVLGGEVLQDASTADMIFGVAELLAFLGQGMTLGPGDVIATGTPPGVGMARSPQRFLAPGDEVVVEIERIGTLSNPVAGA